MSEYEYAVMRTDDMGYEVLVGSPAIDEADARSLVEFYRKNHRRNGYANVRVVRRIVGEWEEVE